MGVRQGIGGAWHSSRPRANSRSSVTRKLDTQVCRKHTVQGLHPSALHCWSGTASAALVLVWQRPFAALCRLSGMGATCVIALCGLDRGCGQSITNGQEGDQFPETDRAFSPIRHWRRCSGTHPPMCVGWLLLLVFLGLRQFNGFDIKVPNQPMQVVRMNSQKLRRFRIIAVGFLNGVQDQFSP